MSKLKKIIGNSKKRKRKAFSNRRPEKARCLMAGPEGEGKGRGEERQNTERESTGRKEEVQLDSNCQSPRAEDCQCDSKRADVEINSGVSGVKKWGQFGDVYLDTLHLVDGM